MKKLLVIAWAESELLPASALALRLALPFDALLLSDSFASVAYAQTVYLLGPGPFPADALASGILETARGYSHIAAVATMASKDLLPRLAALLDGAMATDVVSVLDESTFERAIFAGSVVATIQCLGAPVLLTFRASSFATATAPLNHPKVERLEIKPSERAKILESRGSAATRPDLTQAKLVVSGGRPLKDAQTFERLIGGFADAFGGAVGATRAAVDSGIAPNESQVGQTGKIVAPDLYIAAGISGSTQHMAGIKDSKLIVAVNKDPDAPIFASADFGIVGDLFDVLPRLEAALKHPAT